MLNASKRWGAAAALGVALLAAGCGDDRRIAGPAGRPNGDDVHAAAVVYDQVDFLGNPLVSEVTVPKALHEQYNKTQPYNTATFRPITEQFIVQVGGRPASYASAVAGVLYPDELVVDLTKDPSTAGWLSWTGLLGPAGWGGRKLSDDVVDIGLSAIFSSLLTPEGASCAPFQLPLCTDNVNSNDKPFLSTFPYLAAPNL